MSIALPMAPPIRRDESGALRVGSSRVLLELVVRAFQDGAIPEAIVQRHPTVTLADVSGVIAHDLRDRTAVDEYPAGRERQAADPATIRERLRAAPGGSSGGPW